MREAGGTPIRGSPSPGDGKTPLILNSKFYRLDRDAALAFEMDITFASDVSLQRAAVLLLLQLHLLLLLLLLPILPKHLESSGMGAEDAPASPN